MRRYGRVERIGASSDLPLDPEKSCTLRLERWDGEVRGAVRQGAGRWHYLTSKQLSWNDAVSVGVAAVNASTSTFEPSFTNFEIKGPPVDLIKEGTTARDLIVHQNSALYVMQRDGSQMRRRVRDDDYQWHGGPVLSPRGRKLAWDAHRDGLTSPATFVGDSEGNMLHAIEGATRPIWLNENVLLVNHGRSIYRIDLEE